MKSNRKVCSDPMRRLVRLARWLSAWAWRDETAALRRASILREIANQRINGGAYKDSWWMGVLEGAAHCQTGEAIGGDMHEHVCCFHRDMMGKRFVCGSSSLPNK